MNVEVNAPVEFQGQVMGGLSKRHAVVLNQDLHEGWFTMECEVRLYSACNRLEHWVISELVNCRVVLSLSLAQLLIEYRS